MAIAFSPSPIPASAGIGLRGPHMHEFLDMLPEVAWVEVHSENYFGEGGHALSLLERVRQQYPLSLHGVGLSLGSSGELNIEHLLKLKKLVQRIQPGVVSEHISWSAVDGRHLNALLPLPYTEEALNLICEHIDQTQDFLGRHILVENVSSYLQYDHSTMPEWEFVTEITARTGCGILLDINNIYVSAVNHGFDAYSYLHAIPKAAVQEFHLAGYSSAGKLLLDTHSTPVSDHVWTLYAHALSRFGSIPSIVEWDADIPALAVLLNEAGKAEHLMRRHHASAK